MNQSQSAFPGKRPIAVEPGAVRTATGGVNSRDVARGGWGVAHAGILLFLIGRLLAGAEGTVRASTNRIEGLTLEGAVEMAEQRQPRLAEARAAAEAAAARAARAGTLPDPEVIVSAQQIPVESGASNQREYLAGVAQPVPLGGRLKRAREAELLDQEVRVRGLEVARRDLRRRVHAAFATALYQAEARTVRLRMAAGLEKAAAAVRARVEAGEALPADLARVEMDLAQARMERTRSEALHQQALVELAGVMGDPALMIGSLAGVLEVAFEIPTVEALAADLASHPAVLQADAEARARAARVELTRAERIPDVKVEMLYHRLEMTGENTVDVGLSMTIPVFSRNRERLREARAEAAVVAARAAGTRAELETRWRAAHGALTSALAVRRVLTTEIVPRAEMVLQAAEARHAAGDISLGEVMPVRRDRMAAELAALEALREVMQAWVEVSSYLKAR